MKKYVILGYVYGVGGWQTYIANKLSIMEKEGYKIDYVKIDEYGRVFSNSFTIIK